MHHDAQAAKQSFVAGIFNEDVQVGAERDLNGETCCRFIDACLKFPDDTFSIIEASLNAEPRERPDILMPASFVEFLE